jgi:hypothetical protein
LNVQTNRTALDVAREYCRRGWAVVPVPHRAKNPGFLEWQKLRLTETDLPTRFNGCPQNVGVLLGEPSRWLVDVDLDHPLAVKLGPLFLPTTGAVFGRAGKPRSHWIFRVSAPVNTKQHEWKNPATKKAEMIVELRSTGGQTVFPGSVHESGEPIEWQEGGEPAVVSPDELVAAVERIAETVLAELGEFKKQTPAKTRIACSEPPDRERVLSALAALHPSRADSRGDWIKVGMALHSFDESLLSEWERWSQQSPKYREGEPARKWQSFQRSGVTVRSLFWMAIEDGWRPPKSHASTAFDTGSGPSAAPGAVTNGTPTKECFIPAPMPEIISRINSATDKWPRAAGGALFVHEQETGIAWIGDAASMFGYIGSKAGHPPKFHRDPGAHSKAEVFAEFKRMAISYGSVEVLPHEPTQPDSYYACEFPPAGNGDALRTLVDRFCPATPIDSDLILAFLVTPFWGGRGGSRPVFALTSDHGRGTGKSTAVAVNGRLAGGVIELSMNEDPEVIKQRLLSPDGITKRIACLDNAKTSRFSWADLEALVTSPTVSGKRLYVGEASRPNNLVWALTLNGVSLATDMAQRSVIIKLDRPQHCATWAEETYRFVDDNRTALIGDCLAFLRSERKVLPAYSRWGAWEHDVLSRLPEPAEAQKVIIERQGVSDCEREEAEVVEEFFRGQLAELQYSPSTDRVFMPSTVTCDWYCRATNERHSTIGASRWLNQQIDEGKLPSLTTNRCKTHGRGFVWIGEESGQDAHVKTDLEARLSTQRRLT